MGARCSPQIVFDTAMVEFQNNRVFDPQHAAKFPGASTWAVFSDQALKRGWEVMTSDVYLSKSEHSARTLCISDMATPFTKRVLATGAVPLIIMSGESPNVAWDFYHNVGKYARPYRHAFLFRGAAERVKEPTCFHPLYWPNAAHDAMPVREWNKRQFLVMIASNKQRVSVNERKPLKGARRLAKRLIWSYLRLTDPFFQFEDLYHRRLDAICYFAHLPGFSLFGTGWDQRHGLGNTHWQVIQRIRPTSVEDKLDTLQHFKFALCFENCVFPGYVTEKIFDCFLSGCIPVYWGAPDIADFVPAATFIDARKFKGWAEMESYLREMTENEGQRHHDAIIRFLTGNDYDRFHQDNFVHELVSMAESAFERAGV